MATLPAGPGEERILESVAITSRRALSPGVDGVGLRTHGLRFDNLSDRRLPRPAEEFLVASRMRRWDRETLLSMAAYSTDGETVSRSRVDREPVKQAPLVRLPEQSPLAIGLTEALAARRSVREFTAAPMSVSALAAILRHAAGVTAVGEVDLTDGGVVTSTLRTHASAGGLYPAQAWVVARRVSNLPTGIYRYRPDEDGLTPLPDPDGRLVERFCATRDVQDTTVDIEDAAAILLWVIRPWRSMRKYGARGLRFALQEVGAMSHSAALAVTATNLGSVDYSGFYEDEANDVLGLDGVLETLVHTTAVGVPG